MLLLQLMWAVIMSLAWTRCLNQNDCKPGQVCVYLGDAPRPTCEDCALMHSASSTLVSHGVSESYSNSTLYCEGSLVEVRSATGLSLEHGFARCLFVQIALAKAGLVEYMALAVTFVLLVCTLEAEMRKQLMQRQLRSSLFEWQLITSKLCSVTWLAHGIVRLTEPVLMAALPSLVPYALVVMLVNAATFDAATVLLNGVAICFVMSLDVMAAGECCMRDRSRGCSKGWSAIT